MAQVTQEDSRSPTFDRLGGVGARFYAHARDALTLVSFDADGLGLSSFVEDVAAVTAQGDTLHALRFEGADLAVARYDAMLARTALTPLNTGGTGAFAIASGGGLTLALFRKGTSIEGRIVDGAGNVASPISLGAGSAGSSAAHVAAAWNGSEFVVAWSRALTGGTKTSVARVSAAGAVTSLGDALVAPGGTRARRPRRHRRWHAPSGQRRRSDEEFRRRPTRRRREGEGGVAPRWHARGARPCAKRQRAPRRNDPCRRARRRASDGGRRFGARGLPLRRRQLGRLRLLCEARARAVRRWLRCVRAPPHRRFRIAPARCNGPSTTVTRTRTRPRRLP